MRDLASIEKIEKVTPIPDKDKIELASVGGWEVIVEKNKYKEGDLVVYCEYDTILPIRKEFEFLRSRCYSKLYDGFRIKNMKMAGVFSQGIVFPLSILPDKTQNKAKEGMIVAKDLGIIKYDPEEKRERLSLNNSKKYSGLKKILMKSKLIRRLVLGKYEKKSPYPPTVSKSDETNIQKTFNFLKNNYPEELYYGTEKMEGQAVSYMVLKKGRKRDFRVYSHNIIRSNWKTGTGNWEKVAQRDNLDKKLLKLKENICVQGEICGPGIQRNIYGFKDLTFFVYGIINTDTGYKYNYEEINTFCIDNNLTMVPVLFKNRKLLDSTKEILDEANGNSIFSEGSKAQREGIVWRSMTNPDIGFKAKSPEYLIWFSKKDKTE